MIWRMRGCWMTWFRKGECSRLSAQHKKMTFDQVSVCIQWEYREWKYQKIQWEYREWKYRKMSEVGELSYRFSGVWSSSQEQSSWGNYNRKKRVCTVSMNQGNSMKRSKMKRNVVWVRNSQEKVSSLFWTFCSLFRRCWGQPKRRELQ